MHEPFHATFLQVRCKVHFRWLSVTLTLVLLAAICAGAFMLIVPPSIEEFSQNGFALKNVSLDLHNSKFEGNIMTEYEEKFSEKGFTINYLEARLK